VREECRAVENYVSLEKLRYHDRARIELAWRGDLQPHRLPPMLLMTLVENAFKHGVMPLPADAWIACEVTGEPQALRISVRNSQREARPGTGIGLQNVRAQLDLLYPNRYRWEVRSEPSRFLVEIVLMHEVD
jgi:LytS/YehU family sensor histidine kinase